MENIFSTCFSNILLTRIELLKNRLIVNQIERKISYQNIIDYLNELGKEVKKGPYDLSKNTNKIDRISNLIEKVLSGKGKKRKYIKLRI